MKEWRQAMRLPYNLLDLWKATPKARRVLATFLSEPLRLPRLNYLKMR
jgi:hypothetical protein